MRVLHFHCIPHSFDYKMRFSLQKNLKGLDQSCKMDLALWDCLVEKTPFYIVELHKIDFQQEIKWFEKNYSFKKI